MIYVYTDGSGNNKTHMNGGCGIVLIYKEHKAEHSLGQYINTTSAAMEIKAVLESLKLITNKSISVTLYCDNQYVVNSIAKKWVFKWESEDYLHFDKEGRKVERPNTELWKQVLIEFRKFPKDNVQFHWVRGHNDNKYNEIADKLASLGAKSETILEL